ncbi:hypothetical protein [Providencia rettgeri]|uniref:hypothetical protein n=1 Tax=Providencia TaxID=586 RepID=UPI0030174E4E
MENQLTTDQKIAIANMAKELIISMQNNNLSASHVFLSDDPKLRGNFIVPMFDYLFEHISNKIKES